MISAHGGDRVAKLVSGVARQSALNRRVTRRGCSGFGQHTDGVVLRAWLQDPGGDQASEHVIIVGSNVQADCPIGGVDRVEQVAGALCGDLPRLLFGACPTDCWDVGDVEVQAEFELVALESSGGFGLQRGKLGVAVG
jgi:hypothetical protein